MIRGIVLLCGFIIISFFSNAQCVSGNCINGNGVFVYNSGGKYTGHFVDGKRDGDGIYHYINGDRYEGEWNNEVPQGFGTRYYVDGSKYYGEFSKGKKHGIGTQYYADGSYWDGEWSNNQKTDNGIFVGPSYTLEDEEIVVENSQKSHIEELRAEVIDEKNIQEFIYSDGSKWIGEMKNNLPSGKGVCYYANGDRYEGEWDETGPNGEGVMYLASGRVYGAIWKGGYPIAELRTNTSKIISDNVKTDYDPEVKIWAVIIGVSRYKHMKALRYTDDDAYRMYAFLKSPEGGALPDEQITVLIDEDATRDNIIRQLNIKLKKADENDVILMYYSGHGLKGSFIPIDYDGFHNKLYFDELAEQFKNTKAKHKIIFADACYSGSWLTAKGNYNNMMATYFDAFEQASGGTAILMSSKEDEFSLEDERLRQGIYTHFLIRGLKGEADTNHDKMVRLEELSDYMNLKVTSYTNYEQSPILLGDYNPNMPVAMVRER